MQSWPSPFAGWGKGGLGWQGGREGWLFQGGGTSNKCEGRGQWRHAAPAANNLFPIIYIHNSQPLVNAPSNYKRIYCYDSHSECSGNWITASSSFSTRLPTEQCSDNPIELNIHAMLMGIIAHHNNDWLFFSKLLTKNSAPKARVGTAGWYLLPFSTAHITIRPVNKLFQIMQTPINMKVVAIMGLLSWGYEIDSWHDSYTISNFLITIHRRDIKFRFAP